MYQTRDKRDMMVMTERAFKVKISKEQKEKERKETKQYSKDKSVDKEGEWMSNTHDA